MKQTRVQIGQKQFILNSNQKLFLRAKDKFICYSGGFGSGKSLGFILKTLDLMLRYPNNYGLWGRYNYSDLRDSTVKDFFDVCPPEWIQGYNKQEKTVTFYNHSQLIFRGLKDVKKQEIRSLNLGFFGLEQAEEIDESLNDELTARLRRDVKDFDGHDGVRQGFYTCNPALTWLFKKFVQEKNLNHLLIQSSTLDNAQNLPNDYIQSLLSKPESWKRQFVYGVWDTSLLSDKSVFPIEYIQQAGESVKTPLRTTIDGLKIYEEPNSINQYQIGADPSEGIDDPSVIKAVDCFTGNEVASWVGRIPPDMFAEKIVAAGKLYNNAKLVLEMNGIGLATLTKLKDYNYPNIYVREEFDKIAKVMTQKLGWRTTPATKPLLIGHLQKLLGDNFVKISDEQTIQEMKTFVYSDEVHKKGMGAESGFHDDRVIATALAYWQLEPQKRGENLVIDSRENKPQKELLHLEEIFAQQQDEDWRQF